MPFRYSVLHGSFIRLIDPMSRAVIWRAVVLLVLIPSTVQSDGLGLTSCVNEKLSEQDRVSVEISRAKRIIKNGDVQNAFSSPYLVSALYYGPSFLSEFSEKSKNQHPSRQIISDLKRAITTEFRQRYIAYLTSLIPHCATTREQPLPGGVMRTGRGHVDAVDIFAKEGTPVHALSGGIVVLAENGWNEKDPFSTSSPKGGNTVLVFCPTKSWFIRYCHLREAAVKPGDYVEAGKIIGTVGHSGTNASRRNHGQHLHVEIHRFDPQKTLVTSLPYRELRSAVR